MTQNDLLDDIRARMNAFVPAPLTSIICGKDGADQPFKMSLQDFFDRNEFSADEQYLIQGALAVDGTAQIDTGNGASSTIYLVPEVSQ